MCTFITAAISEGADLAGLQDIFQKLTSGFKVVTSTPEHADLPPGRIYLRHLVHCDCGTEVGRGPRQYHVHVTPDDVAKLRKKGWGEAKIKRWLDEKELAEGKQQKEHRPKADDWLELAREILQAPTVKSFGLMYHTYGDESEPPPTPIQFLPSKSIKKAELSDLYELPGDTLIEYTP